MPWPGGAGLLQDAPAAAARPPRSPAPVAPPADASIDLHKFPLRLVLLLATISFVSSTFRRPPSATAVLRICPPTHVTLISSLSSPFP